MDPTSVSYALRHLCVHAQSAPDSLPAALARIAELEENEARLNVALQEALAAIEVKNRVLEEAAQYIEGLDAELTYVSCLYVILRASFTTHTFVCASVIAVVLRFGGPAL